MYGRSHPTALDVPSGQMGHRVARMVCRDGGDEPGFLLVQHYGGIFQEVRLYVFVVRVLRASSVFVYDFCHIVERL